MIYVVLIFNIYKWLHNIDYFCNVILTKSGTNYQGKHVKNTVITSIVHGKVYISSENFLQKLLNIHLYCMRYIERIVVSNIVQSVGALNFPFKKHAYLK